MQPTRNLSQGCVIMARDAKRVISKPTETDNDKIMLSAVFLLRLALSEKSIRQRERFCLEILREIQHSAAESKDKMTLGVGDEPMPFFYGKIVGAACADDLGYSYRAI